jgi:hypothetical protein
MLADTDYIMDIDLAWGGEPVSIDVSAIGASEIMNKDRIRITVIYDFRVVPGGRRIQDNNIVAGHPANGIGAGMERMFLGFSNWRANGQNPHVKSKITSKCSDATILSYHEMTSEKSQICN